MAKARQYQTGKLVLLKQCYHCANMGTFSRNFEDGAFYHPPILLGLKRTMLLANHAVDRARPKCSPPVQIKDADDMIYDICILLCCGHGLGSGFGPKTRIRGFVPQTKGILLKFF